jgi:hypothetical protein
VKLCGTSGAHPRNLRCIPILGTSYTSRSYGIWNINLEEFESLGITIAQQEFASDSGATEELSKATTHPAFYFLDSYGVAVIGKRYLLKAFARLSLLGSGDIKKGIVFRAIWASNVRRLSTSDDNGLYDSLDSPPPPIHLLQPTSALAVAEAMRMPYENVRRQIIKLRHEGFCVQGPNSGLIVDLEALERHPARSQIVQQSVGGIRQLIADLHRLGFDFSRLAKGDTNAPISSRAIMRIGAQLDMQLFDTVKELDKGDLIDWFVNFAIWEANTSGYYEEHLCDPHLVAAPNEDLVPISVRALAPIVGLPMETTRRRVNALLSRGLLARVDDGGVIVPHEVWANDRHRAVDRRFCIIIARAMAELARQGAEL